MHFAQSVQIKKSLEYHLFFVFDRKQTSHVDFSTFIFILGMMGQVHPFIQYKKDVLHLHIYYIFIGK
jgi:hypothetical protein